MIEFDCPECGGSIEVPDAVTADVHTCPNCGATVEIPDDLKGQRLPWWVGARRYTAAFLAYLVYWVVLFGAFRMAMLYALWNTEAIEALKAGEIETFGEFGWGDHYVWFTIIVVLVSFFCGCLAGAIAKKRGGLVAGLSVIPIVGFLGLLCYMCYTVGLNVESPVAWGITIPVSLLASAIAAVLGGIKGQAAQEDDFEKRTVLGIHPMHWLWLWLPGYIYFMAFACAFVRALAMNWAIDYGSFIGVLPYLLLAVPALAYGIPMYYMYGILGHNVLEKRHAVLRALAFLGIYVGGLIVGAAVEWACIGVWNWLPGWLKP